MDKAWMIRNDGKAFPIIQHIYAGWDNSPEGVEETLFAAEWLYKAVKDASTKKTIIKLISCWAQFNGAAEDTFMEDLLLLLDTPYKILTNSFVKSISRDLIRASQQDFALDDLENFADIVRQDLNQQFLRARYGGLYNTRAGSREMVFRISSTGFNWYNIIYQFVVDHEREISTVTIVRDEESTGVKNGFYKTADRRDVYNNYPIDQFLVEPGRPVVEKKHLFMNKRSDNNLEQSLLTFLEEGCSISKLRKVHINSHRLDTKLQVWKAAEERRCVELLNVPPNMSF